MQSSASKIDYFLELFRHGDADNAFHSLQETDRILTTELVAAFRSEHDIEVREFLVNVIWERRNDQVIPFLGELLFDSEPRLWRQSLNGLVALASPASLDALRAARSRKFTRPGELEEFRDWLEEAIGQAETAGHSVESAPSRTTPPPTL